MDTDLSTFARDAAARGDDLYALLAIDALASESDIRRAFRRKALTAHPDKAGDAYDPVYYERLERTRDVLLSADARKVYDDGMRAVHEKRRRLGEMDARRRRLVEELEARENAAKRAKTGEGAPQRRDPEREAMVARGRKIAEERRRLMKEAEERDAEREREKKRAEEAEAATSRAAEKEGAAAVPEGGEDYDAKIADLERRIRENKERKQRKAEEKARKKGKKGEAKGPSPPPHDSPSPGTEADGLKQPSEKTSESASGAPIPHRPSTHPPTEAGNRFASTMARLRAAQAEKRRRAEEKAAEEAAKASAGTTEASMGPTEASASRTEI